MTVTAPPPAGPSSGGGRGATAVLVLSAVIAAAFFAAFWARNAEALGRHDMGIALAASFAVPLAFYASLACAAAAVVGLLASWAGARPRARWLAALVVALLPLVFLAIKDAM